MRSTKKRPCEKRVVKNSKTMQKVEMCSIAVSVREKRVKQQGYSEEGAVMEYLD